MNLDDYIEEKFNNLYPDKNELDGDLMRIRKCLFEAGAAHAEYFHYKEMFKVMDLQIIKDDQINKLKVMLKSCKGAMDYAFEDHADQYYLKVKESIDKTLKELET